MPKQETSNYPSIPLMEQIQITKKIFTFTKPFRKGFAIAVIWTILLSLVNMGIPLIFQTYLDDYLVKDRSTLAIALVFALLYLAATLVKMLCQYFGRYYFALASERTVKNIRDQMFAQLNKFGMRFFDQTPAGAIVSRITNDTETIKEFWDVFLSLMESLFGMVSAGLAMYWLNPTITLYFLLLSPFMFLAVYLYQKYSSITYRSMREKLSRLNTTLNESIQGMSLIQAFGQQNRSFKEFEEINEAYSKDRVKMIAMNALLLNPIISLIQALAVVLVLYLFGKQAQIRLVDVGIIYAFTSYIQNFFRPMGMLMDNLSVLQDGVVSSSRVLTFMNTQELEPEQTGLAKQEITKGRIEFKNVTFSYDGQHPVLKNISFVIEPGQTLALVGHTGSGKSSIINLFLRFYDFSQGEILIDGVSIKDYTKEELRKAIGLVLQDSFLFYGDVARNIALMNPDYSEKEIRQAAQFVHADQFIEKLDGAYHSKVIERGASYSSGERQLISFARTMLRQPKILVLDEATANIDTQTEQFIQDSLKRMRQDRTTIAIAHRLSTIHDADQILVLDKGVIIEAGTHNELINKEGTYYDMYRLQSM